MAARRCYHGEDAMQAELSSGELSELKRRARAAAQKERADAHRSYGDTAAFALAKHGLPIAAGEGMSIVSGFFPFTTEISVLPLLAKLASEGWTTALPVVLGKNLPLKFRLWTPGEPTVAGVWDIPMPPETAAEVLPDVVLVPMLAVDNRGFRLGYGGGFYDRTLNVLRKNKSIEAIGIAYAAQEITEVPHGERDEPLDWILTERGIRKPERA
jgi:5-formyltetrahydrofolate cyclo-ligase